MQRLTLRNRIYLSSAVVVGLLFVVAIVNAFGLTTLSGNVQRLREADNLRANILTLDRDVQELRLRVDRYVVSGHASLVDEIAKIHRRLLDTIEVARSAELDQVELEDRFAGIRGRLAVYAEKFDLVVEERKLREDLVKEKLPAISTRIDQRLTKVAANFESAEDIDSLLAATRAHASFSNADKLILRYFETPESRLVESSLSSLSHAAAALKELPIPPSDLEVLLSDIGEFEQFGLRAVLATKGYLFLRHVVMAGEASEISFYSRALRKAATDQREAIALETQRTNERLRTVASVSTLLAAVLALLISGRLVMLVVPPIAALTETFTRLSSGETLDEVPGVDRSDEIGKMAEAARVFSDQNRRTNELLEESRALGESLKMKSDQLQATNEELDSFAYAASHDLRSPLRGIRQLATWIEEEPGNVLTPRTGEYLEELKQRVGKMETLLLDLLDFSRVGRVEPRIERVDVAELLREIAQITDNPRGVAIRWSDSMPVFDTVRAPLKQVLLNLVSNAVKHHTDEVDPFVEIDIQRVANQWRFRVTDNGPGIAPQNHERAFQMYQRVGDPRVHGSGMGLAIVKKQVESYDGEISLKSDLNQGAEFTFTWPVELSRADGSHSLKNQVA